MRTTFAALEQEVRGMEDRELGEDVIKEEDEEEDEGEFRETDDLLSPGMAPPPRPAPKSRTSFMNRMAPSMGRRRKSILPTGTTHEADLHEGQLRTQRSRSTGRVSFSADDGANLSPKALGRGRRSSDFESSEDGPLNVTARDRRTSLSSTSSHEREHDINLSARSNMSSLGLVPMDPAEVPEWLWRPEGRDVEEDAENRDPIYIWTGSGNYGTFARIALKKKISRVWLDTYSLKQYVDLNLTAFEKILKKYDKNTNSKVRLHTNLYTFSTDNQLKKEYVANVVLQSDPWRPSTREALDQDLGRILFLYRRVVVGGDEDLAKEQLRSQLREKVVVDRETVWSQMVSGRREQGIFRSVEPDEHVSAFEHPKGSIKTPLGRFGLPSWWSGKAAILVLALIVMFVIVQVQPFDRVEESNCLAMLVFCTMLWATEVGPLHARQNQS
jgi:phosphate transporter